MKLFKVLSLLLSYPTQEILDKAGVLKKNVAETGLLAKSTRAGLMALIDELADAEALDAQERYVTLFDRTRALSLHLFEHVHGESRDRGQAMVDLLELYRKQSLVIEGGELPDYLPLFLEYLSLLQPEEGRALLAEPLHILAALRRRLEERESPYAVVFQALEELADAKADAGKVEELLENEPDPSPTDLAALDATWEETEVRFGPDAQETGCPRIRSIVEEMSRAIDKDKAGGETG